MLDPLTDATWEAAARRGPLLLGFWADWCIPSRSLQAVLATVEAAYGGRMAAGLVDHDANPRLAETFAVRGLPTVVMVDGGREVLRRVGLIGSADLTRLVEQTLAVHSAR